MTKSLYPLRYVLIVDNIEFSRTIHVARFPRMGSTITAAGHKFKVIAENQSIDIYDTDQLTKNDKAAEGIVAIPRSIPENGNRKKIQEGLRAPSSDRRQQWEEGEVTAENLRLLKALNAKGYKNKPEASHWITLILSILLFVYSVLRVVIAHEWPMVFAILFSGLMLSRAASKKSIFRS